MTMTLEQLEQLAREQLMPPGYTASLFRGDDEHVVVVPSRPTRRFGHLQRGQREPVEFWRASVFTSLKEARQAAWEHFDAFGEP